MAAVNNKKLRAYLLFNAGRAFWRGYKEKHSSWNVALINKSEQMKHPKLRAELRPNENWVFTTLILTTNKMFYYINSTEMLRWQKMYSLQKIQAWYSSRLSRDNCRTCLWSCSKEGFKTVSILIANISCEIWIPEINITMWRPRHRRKTKKRVCKHVFAILTTYKETILWKDA